MTLAPPPATIFQILPLGFRTVNFKDALVCNHKKRGIEESSFTSSKNHEGDKTFLDYDDTFSSNPWMKLSVGLITLPNGIGYSVSPHLQVQGLSYGAPSSQKIF